MLNEQAPGVVLEPRQVERVVSHDIRATSGYRARVVRDSQAMWMIVFPRAVRYLPFKKLVTILVAVGDAFFPLVVLASNRVMEMLSASGGPFGTLEVCATLGASVMARHIIKHHYLQIVFHPQTMPPASHALILACSSGSLTVSKMIWNAFMKPSTDMEQNEACVDGVRGSNAIPTSTSPPPTRRRAHFPNYAAGGALHGASAKGHINICKWLHTVAKIPSIDWPQCFTQAAEAGHIHIVQWIIDTIPKSRNLNVDQAFIAACSNGRLEVATLIADVFSGVLNTDTLRCGYESSCQKNHVTVSAWLYNTYSERLPSPVSYVLWIKQDTSLEMVKWLLSKVDRSLVEKTIAHSLQHHIFRCERLRWVFQEHKNLAINESVLPLILEDSINCGDALTAEAILQVRPTLRASSNEKVHVFLHAACTNGHLDMAKWIAKTFTPTRATVRSPANLLFHTTCMKGHLEVAKWLAQEFALDGTDLFSNSDSTFLKVCHTGKTRFVKWIATHFSLTEKDARMMNNEALRSALGNGHVKTAQFLVDHFSLTESDAIADKNGALRYSVLNKQYHSVRWLIKKFPAVLNAELQGVLQATAYSGDVETASWVIKEIFSHKPPAKATAHLAVMTALLNTNFSVAKVLLAGFSNCFPQNELQNLNTFMLGVLSRRNT
ncbi:hypothetical protein Pelo_16522 [Pelomyxa schiedti]|nr:hypothetical protein Pelo_16522 [Pelomyxa schiedti]